MLELISPKLGHVCTWAWSTDIVIRFWGHKVEDECHSRQRHNHQRQFVEFHLVAVEYCVCCIRCITCISVCKRDWWLKHCGLAGQYWSRLWCCWDTTVGFFDSYVWLLLVELISAKKRFGLWCWCCRNLKWKWNWLTVVIFNTGKSAWRESRRSAHSQLWEMLSADTSLWSHGMSLFSHSVFF